MWSQQSPGCLVAGVQGSNHGWGCSIRGGSPALIGHGHAVKWPKEREKNGNNDLSLDLESDALVTYTLHRNKVQLNPIIDKVVIQSRKKKM